MPERIHWNKINGSGKKEEAGSSRTVKSKAYMTECVRTYIHGWETGKVCIATMQQFENAHDAS